MSRRTVSLVVVAFLLVLLVLIAPDVLLLVFAGVLFGVMLQGGGSWIAAKTGIHYRFGLAIFVVLLVGTAVVAATSAAPALIDQFNELWRQVPDAAGKLAARLDDYSWGKSLLDAIRPRELLSARSGGMAASALFSTFGALGSFVLILFIGIYLAVAPGLYAQGATALFAPSVRPRAHKALRLGVHTLRHWIGAQLISMTVVGVLTGLGLWLLGIPLAFILGALAALLAFIPNIGPILAAVPAVLLAFADGPTTVLWVVGIYVAVQTVESYLITPVVQQESVSLPPVLTISVQLLLGSLYGILGLALATPLAALGLALIGSFYVGDYLNDEPVAAPAPNETGTD
ncbi:putative PurR-regulated permease PerM [Constrictibacter sp. MBR-5]|jgi:predicted PurR-regulated permease PerM|uniref:AI-2E family transporter n=1 Tax=Constrictibacter sp. MBR-5 TaxID=3156467 RepID=UPI003390BE55